MADARNIQQVADIGSAILDELERAVVGKRDVLDLLLTGLLAFNNVRNGNDDIKLKPTVNLVWNPRTQQLEPAVTGNVQVGTGTGSTTFGVGGAFSQGNIAPIATTSINGPEIGGVAQPAITSGFVFNEGHTDAVVGGQVGSDHLSHNVGSLGSLLNGRSCRAKIHRKMF